jgi:hypothetical protein
LLDALSLIEEALLTFATADGNEYLDVVGKKRFAGSRGSRRR